MGRLRVRRLLTAGAVLVLVGTGLAGCGERTGEPARAGAVRPTADPGGASDPVPPGPARSTGLPELTARPAGCRPGVPHRIEAVGPEAALGHRYLTITVVNCGRRPLEVAGVPEVALDSEAAIPRAVRPRLWERRPPVTVPPRGRAAMGLEYLVGDRSSQVRALVVTVDGHPTVLAGTLDLDARSRLTAYPWVAEGESVWA